MARSKSIILSKEEKRAVITDLKAKIAAARTACKEVIKTVKTADKNHAAFVKAHEKTLLGVTKDLASYEAQLQALTSHPAA